ncbi:pyruvate ferredoxin oxidoreductase [SAR202 cluster bacterium AD-804-J14_MRT_500m]|nr:pyruvate ferredoxin oxidoreductase [SAR202 cluster bacterium AD-804-J14_MRT_500m]
MTTETQANPLETEELISGSEAIARACALADVDVITAYPIRPYDTVMQFISRMIADGELKCEYIVAESEHSQFEIVKHASAVGARVFTGSSGVGWFYAFEALAVTCGLRLPMVAMVGNRALDDPGAFGTEHNDALAVRDLGWMLNWAATAQDCIDTALMAWRVAEDPRVYLPVAISTDGAFLTHSQQIVKVPDKSLVDKFLPPYDRGKFQLHPDNPITIAPQVNEDWLMEIRRQTDAAMRRARDVITETHEDFKRIFGRGGDPFLEEYMTDDADVVLLGMGTLTLPLKVTVRRLREKGQKVGFIRVKWFRPFPAPELIESLSRFKAVGVIDRDYSLGSPFNGGVLFTEVKAAMYSAENRVPIIGFIAGLGGREVTVPATREMFEITQKAAEAGKIDNQIHWIGVRD